MDGKVTEDSTMRYAEFDAAGRLIAASTGFMTEAGPAEFLRGLRAVDGSALDPAQAEAAWRAEGAGIEARDRAGLHLRLVSHPNGSGGRTLLALCMPVRDAAPTPDRHGQMLLGDALRHLSEAVALFDEGGRLITCNERYREINAAVEEFIQPGVHWETLLRELARRRIPSQAAGREARWVRDVLSASDTGKTFEMPRSDGSVIAVSVHPTALQGFVVSEVDITARKTAEAAAQQSETMLSKILENSPANLCMSHIGSGEIIYRSPACADLCGADRSAKDQFAHPVDRADFLTELLPTGRIDGFAAEARRADGEAFPALFSARIIEFRGEEVMVSSITDLSEQLRARTALAHANTRMHDAIEALDEGFALYDSEARLVMWNRRYAELNAHVKNEIRVGARYVDVLRAAAATGRLPEAEFTNLADDGLHSNAAARYEFRHADDTWFQVARNPTTDGGFVITRLDITERRRAEAAEREADARIRTIVEACPVILVMNRYCDGEVIYRTKTASASFGTHEGAESFWLDQDMRRAIATETHRTGRVDSRIVDLRRPDNTTMKASISCRLIDFGGEEMIVSHVYDLTERVAMEEELSRQTEMLHQSEKLSALGELLAGVAHELNNPLSLVVGHALMLEEEIADPGMRARIGKISAAAERCAKIVKTFLAMARQRPARLEPVSVVETIETAVDVAGYGLRRTGAQITVDLAPDLPAVTADADQLAQVFSNLIVNAEHALAGLGAAARLTLRGRAQSGQVEITFDDNGPGIPAKIRKRIFEPFFTTKEVGEGTGIGLAFCHRIIGAHGGEITAEQAPGGGARFRIRLNSATSAAQDPRPDDPAAAPRHKVLVIDDEPGVAELIGGILSADGYRVDTALSGEAALDLLPGAYDLVLSDLNMPGMGGRALYAKIKERWPDLAYRLGFITGDTMSPDAEAFLAQAGRPTLEKPVAPSELRRLAARLAKGAGSMPQEGSRR
ncbi:MAG: PAS-domain containing protein [Pseudomonadota bacterium]